VLYEVEYDPDQRLRAEMRRRFGFGYSNYDICYIQGAIAHEPHYLISEDSDMYDPELKRYSSNSRRVIEGKIKRKGIVCQWLLREHNVTVGTVEHASDDLEVAIPNV
jgi:hypothetical protein